MNPVAKEHAIGVGVPTIIWGYVEFANMSWILTLNQIISVLIATLIPITIRGWRMDLHLYGLMSGHPTTMNAGVDLNVKRY